MADFSGEAENFQRNNSRFKSKFFKVSRYSASRKADCSRQEESKNEAGNPADHPPSLSKSINSRISDEYLSSNDGRGKRHAPKDSKKEDSKEEDDNLALPPASSG